LWEKKIDRWSGRRAHWFRFRAPMGEWQPIDTAPKNGPPIRVKRGTLEATVQWCVWLDDWVLGTAPIRQGGACLGADTLDEPLGTHVNGAASCLSFAFLWPSRRLTTCGL